MRSTYLRTTYKQETVPVLILRNLNLSYIRNILVTDFSVYKQFAGHTTRINKTLHLCTTIHSFLQEILLCNMTHTMGTTMTDNTRQL